MGKIELDHTGTGGGITLSSDGTSLLLDGTAIGGSALELYAENPNSPTALSATGSNAVAIGSGATSTNNGTTAVGSGADATGNGSGAFGRLAQATGLSSHAFGLQANASGSYATAIGRGGGVTSVSAGSGSTSIGGAYASGTDSLAAAIANNTSSYGATGTNSIAIGYQAKATSDDAVAIGDRGVASGSSSLALGGRSEASGSSSVAIGLLSDATAQGAIALGNGYTFNGAQATFYNSIAIGQGSLSDKIGKVAVSGAAFSSSGDGQHGIFVLRVATTDATATPLITGPDFTGSYTADDENQIILPNNSAYAFHGTIVARQQAAGGTASAAWKIEGLIRREGSAGTTVLVNSATTVLDNTPSWGMALSADTTNGGLKIEVTGAASTNIRWVATIHTSEVTYA